MPTVPGMDDLFQKAKKADHNTDPVDPALVDYATKAVTLYRILIPKFELGFVDGILQFCAGQWV